MPKLFEEETMLRKALTSVDSADLRSEDLDPVLHEELVEKQPLLSLFDVQQADGKVHEYRKITSHPKGWFEGESTPANARTGTYSRETVQLKILRNWGEVTGFNQAVTAKDLDMLALEIDLSLQGLSDMIEWSTLYGTASDQGFSGDAYAYSGILAYIYNNAASTNVFDGGGNKITLGELDAMIDVIDYRGTDGDPKFFIMANNMKQVVDGLQTQVQMNINSAQLFDGKITMGTYDSLPIFTTNMVKPPSSSGVTGLAAVEGSDVSSGAANSEYGFRVSSITFEGEGVAVAEATVTPTADYDVDLSWTADAAAYAYMIWVEPAAGGGHDLIDIIPAFTYDSAGTVSGNVEAYNYADFSVVNENIQCLEADEQMIILANASNRNGASYLGLVDSMGQQVESMVSYVPLARTKDSYDFMLKSYLTMKVVNPLLFSVLRHVKLA